MIGMEHRVHQAEHILAQRAAETTMLLQLQDGQYYTLNAVGGRVWELCDGTRRVSEIVALICQQYDAPAEIIEADVVELLHALADEQLVVAVHASTGDAATSA